MDLSIEGYNLILEKFGIKEVSEWERTTLVLGAKTTDEHIEVLANLAALQMRLFALSLKIDTGLSANHGDNSEFLHSKHFYDKVLEQMSVIYEFHAETLLEEGITTRTVETNV